METKEQLGNQEDMVLEQMPTINGYYSESLISGGTLEISRNLAKIHFYFPGIDRRYNGTFFDIQESEIDAYIEAYRDNWKQAEELITTAKLHPNTKLAQSGKKGIKIEVCNDEITLFLHIYYLPIRSKEECDKMIENLEYAKKRIAQIRSLIWK